MTTRLGFSLLALFTLGLGCTGGQTGEVAPDPCDFLPDSSSTTAADYAFADTTALGLSGDDALAGTGGAGSVALSWADGTTTTATWSLRQDTESAPAVAHIDRGAMCGDEYLKVLTWAAFATEDLRLDHENRTELYRSDTGRADLIVSYTIDANPLPEELPSAATGDGCSDCASTLELVVHLTWAADATTPTGTIELLEAGTLLGRAATF